MYPYYFKPNTTGINHREIFVVMPFDVYLDNIYNDLILPATFLVNQKLSITAEELKYMHIERKTTYELPRAG